MKQKKEKRITVGDYEVTRRGSRIVVLSPADELEPEEYPESIEVALSLKQVREVLALRNAEEKKDELQAKIDKLQDQIYELEGKLNDLEDTIDIAGYDVSPDGDNGIEFGCTNVDSKTLDEIEKLLS